MTTTRYIVARFAQAFGFFRRNIRMSEAASETHLLREAEFILGSTLWEQVENIEALSVEYWNLRKLIKERDDVVGRLIACQERLNQAHEERVTLLNSTPELNLELLEQRIVLLNEAERLSRERDLVVAQAREVRRIYLGLSMKHEVLSKEFDGTAAMREEIEGVRSRMMELKSRFVELKQERIRIGDLIESGDTEVDVIDEKLKEARQHRRAQASETFQIIGEGNKELAVLRAESGLIDTRMRQLYAEIGRYVSRNNTNDPACGAVVATQRGLVEVMRALRRSISLNHRLAGNH